jgi:hypothetical protein
MLGAPSPQGTHPYQWVPVSPRSLLSHAVLNLDAIDQRADGRGNAGAVLQLAFA